MRARQPAFTRSSVALAAAALMGSLAATPASAAVCTWNAANGNWNAFANWLTCAAGNGNPAGTPGSNDSATIGATGVVTVNTAQNVGTLNNGGQVNIDAASLTLFSGANNAGGVINVAPGALLIQNGAFVNGGTINTSGTGRLRASNSNSNLLSGVTLNGAMDLASSTMVQRITNGLTLNGSIDVNSNSVLSFSGGQTLGGTGTVVLGNTGGSNRALSMEGNTALVIGSGITVRGQNGTIGQAYLSGGTQSIVNNGRIAADVAGGSISLEASSGVTNAGILEAQNGGTLVLNSSVIGLAGSSIAAGAGSAVVQNGVSLSGVINTSGDGSFRASNNINNFLNGVTFNGVLDLASSTMVERVTGGLTLNGTVNINSNSVLSFSGDQTLGGNGTVVLGNTGGSNRALSMQGDTVLTIGPNVVVRGQNGSLGQAYLTGGNQRLVNNGRISADVLGGSISLEPSGGTTNNGVIEAKNGATLVLNSAVTGSVGSSIVSGAGSSVVQNGVALSGVINTSGDGDFRASNNNGNFLNGVSFNGALNLASSTMVERVTGGLTLNGSVNINSNSVLSFGGDQTLGGNATLVLGNTGGSNRIGLEGDTVLTLGANTLVRGENGTIGVAYLSGGTQKLINNGRISADVAGGSISLQPSQGTTNNGIIEAKNGGTLVLNSDVFGSASGSIIAGAGSAVVQNGVVLSGIINTSGNGAFRASNNNSNFLDGVSFNGVLDLASSTMVERVTGGLTLNGSINVNNNSVLSFGGNQTLGGTGSIVLGDTGGSNRALSMQGDTTLTIGAGISVSGKNGTLGQAYLSGGNQVLVNNGSIQATVGGGTIALAPTLTQNAALLGAANGGTLRLDSAVTQTGAGQILAANGSAVHQNGVTITGGLIDSVGTGRMTVANSTSNFLSNVTLAGLIDMSSTSVERVTGGLTLNKGRIDVNANSVLSFSGDQTLGGTGSIVLGDTGGSNRALSLEGNTTLTVGAGVVVRGQNGTLGQAYLAGGTQNIINNGSIISDGGGTITVTPTSMANNGLMRAQNGTLTIQSPLSGTGTLQVDATGIANLANGAKTQGTLTMGAAGAALNLGTGNLTLMTDYTNAGAGVGNAFNRRAGVSGAGLIVAGGDVTQVITGANISNGNTANATLTIGNVRVGANNFNYTIGAGGTTGPAMRGAVQTNVNGANLTDGRLGGGGVTASNYNGGAPGGSGETRTVTFTAGSAGALAPMTGQVLNLRSTYDNIADQKLNIVLGANAAAYNAALGSAVSPVQVANQRVGGTNTATLAIRNDAAPGAFSEDLNASIASLGGQATGSGSVSGRLANTGNTGTGAITVGVDTSSAGAKTGLVNLNYQSAGTVNGVSNGLAAIGVGGQSVTVNGNVYQAATGQLVGNTFNFGTLQVGQQVSTDLAARNIATGTAGYVEDLNVRFGASGNGQISGSGSFTGIQAGATSNAGNGTMTVTVNGTTAGALNSSIAVNYFSAGAVAGVSNGLGELARGGENFGVNGTINAVGNVINQASPQFGATSVNLGAVRVGAAAPTANIQLTNQSVGGQQAALSASIASNGAPVTASGAVNLLAPGASSSALQVGLNTAVAGNFTGGNAGSATVSLVSDASNVGNCGANCTLNLASQQITVQGKVYTAAVGAASGTTIDFGIVRVGDTVSARNITINNNAAASALNDSLRADVSGLSGPLAAGSVAGVAAQASGQIGVTLSTANAGVFDQSGLVQFLSQNGDMADISAGPDEGIDVKAQVNNLANAVFGMAGGMGNLSRVGDTFYLDYGNVVEGNALSSTLNLINQVAGPADELDGSFDVSGAGAFSLNGWSAFNDLTAGNLLGGLGLNYLAATLGSFQQQIVLNGFSDNASDLTNGIARTINLVLRGNVVAANQQVPEPGSLALVLLAAAVGWQARRRRTA
ncbi:MAG: S-layer family protein [Rubrivivax sp.]|nr:S-layer family protein [Rubrivivax sp.]